ncbi:MAG: hypothetical protein GKS00_01120 [Alphaproteobacteria bacterium]|nr:hypothetical protein [Alphaproteobacteria bacterium]
MEEDEKNYNEKMDRQVNEVNSREDLFEFVRLLAHGYQQGFEEEQSVADYLDGYAALVEALDSWYRNQSLEMPEHPNWNMMARLLAAAFSHS